MELIGRRREGNVEYRDAQPGDYWKPDYEHRQPNEWWFRDPTGSFGRVVHHQVAEHDDGTITVHPSILRTGGDTPGFHGWLKRGVWSW